MKAAYPFDHQGEADRWDFRYTIVYPDAKTAYEDFDLIAILEELYPDQETFRKEEQRRFELLIEHKVFADHPNSSAVTTRIKLQMQLKLLIKLMRPTM